MGAIRRVLVLDDDAQLISAYVRWLRQLDSVQVLSATSIAAARLLLQRQCLHLALIDRVLPDGNGIEFVEELRVTHGEARLIVVSGHNDTPSTVGALRAGADDVIDKPINVRMLERQENALVVTRPERAASLDLAMWRYIHRTFIEHASNKSETARQLRIDRNTLKRWLRRPAPPS